MTLGLGDLLELLAPLDATGQAVDRRRIAFPHRVVHNGLRRTGSRDRPLRIGGLTVVEHGPEREHCTPVERRIRSRNRHHAVAELAWTSKPFGPFVATTMGVVTGNFDTNSGPCSIWASAPSISTFSPLRSARTCSM